METAKKDAAKPHLFCQQYMLCARQNYCCFIAAKHALQ